MATDIFVDGVGNIHLTGNVVRLDLVSLQPTAQNDGKQPVYEMSQRVIMPVEGFLQAFQLQENLVKQLMEAGILTRKADPAAVEAPQSLA